jgi:hypothetical protein
MTRAARNFWAPPSLPIAASSATPNPGVVGATAFSTITQSTLYWTGSAWLPLGGVAAGGRGMTTVSFGAGGGFDATALVTGQTGISASSVVMVDVAAIATSDHSVDEHVLEDLVVRAGAIVPGVGFTIFARVDRFKLFGSWNISWQWS